MISETIEGGAYLSADGKTWRNANGEPLKEADANRAQKLLAKQQDEMDTAEAKLMNDAAQRDPVARALTTVLQGQQSDKDAQIAELRAQLAAATKGT